MRLSRLGSGWEPLVRQVAAALRPGLAVPAEPIARMLDLVVDWNARIDLTAARGSGELVDLFVADALVLAEHARPGERWVDVGSGAGAPGIPLALVVPEIDLTLIEPRSKRVAFLRTALGALGRSDVRVTRARSEELEPASFDVAVSRATLPSDEWLSEGARIATASVWVLVARGDAPALTGWQADHDVAYRWPLTGVARRAVRYVRERG